MQLILSLENNKNKGFLVYYREIGKDHINELYSSMSKSLARDEYFKIKRRIDIKSFRVIEEKDEYTSLYTVFECLLQFVLFKVNSEPEEFKPDYGFISAKRIK